MTTRKARKRRLPGLGTLCAGLLLAGLLLGPAVARADPSPAPVRVHTDAYEGRFGTHPRFGHAFGRLEDEVPRSLVRIEERLGIVPGDEGRIHVFIQDAERGTRSVDRARCYTKRIGGAEVHRVILFAEYFLSGDSDLPTVLTHELVHAVMRDRMGASKYERLPYWIREGLAVHAADEGTRHLRRTLLACQDPNALLTGLMGRTRDIRMYPYAYLGIDFIEERGGKNALRRFVRGLVEGRHPRSLIHALTGMPWSQFKRELYGYARERIEDEADGLRAIRAARRLYRRGRYDRARSAFDDFIVKYPASAFVPTARYYAARCFFKRRAYEAAEAGFARCIETDIGVSGWIDECFLYRGIALHERKRNEEAVDVLRAYVDFHAYSDQRDLGYLALGRALRGVGRDDQARQAFESVSRVPRARGVHRRAASRELAELAQMDD